MKKRVKGVKVLEYDFDIDDFIDYVGSKLGCDVEAVIHENIKFGYGLPYTSKAKLRY